MFKGFYNLTSAMITHGKELDVISNNMTNVATAGYKSQRMTPSTFKTVMWQVVGNKNKSYEELGEQSFITAPSALVTDFTEGALEETGQPLDFCILDQNGFFAIETDNGRVYTRNGNFSLDDESYLCLPGQGRVLGYDEQPIQLTTDRVHGDSIGTILDEDNGIQGRVGVFTFEDTDALAKNEQGLFEGDGAELAPNPRVYNGALERSNVDWLQSMVEMMSAQRAYQSAAEVLRIYDQLSNRATTDVGRLGT